MASQTDQTRRQFIKTSTAASIGLAGIPWACSTSPQKKAASLMKRDFGRCNFEVTSMALGGQASLQWTPDDVDPVPIILKAHSLGINYYDTSNLYGPSQVNFGKAFKELNLVPGLAGYKEAERKKIFLTTKTHLRTAKGEPAYDNVNRWTNGPAGSKSIDDIKRSLTQMFGDGKGNYPKGAYLDMVLFHNLTSFEDVETLYEGLDNPDPQAERIGSLAALRDLRDGTNLTGLNPGEEKLIKHIGFSGHYSSPVMMEMIRRDEHNLLDGMLVAINANDKLNLNMQYNVIPVAAAKNMGVIAMKVFADGAMYSKPAEWSNKPHHVVRTVGGSGVPPEKLVQYSLSIPGVSTAIMGIGQIADEEAGCQLLQNTKASQIEAKDITDSDKKETEQMAAKVKAGKTNYFQLDAVELGNAENIQLSKSSEGSTVTWNSAIAADAPIVKYEVLDGEMKLGEVAHKPQVSNNDPFAFKIADDQVTADSKLAVRVVDEKGRTTKAEIS